MQKSKIMNIKENSNNSEQKQTKRLNLTQLKVGKSAMVASVKGEKNVVSKIESIGISSGVKIKKVGSSLFHGPIIVEKDFMQIAVGYDMAKQIFIEILD